MKVAFKYGYLAACTKPKQPKKPNQLSSLVFLCLVYSSFNLFFLGYRHPWWKSESYCPNSLRPISYLEFIWDLYVLGLKSKVVSKKQPNTQNHGQRTHIAKMGAVVWLKIPKMPQNLLIQFVCPSPKVWDIIKKGSLGVNSLCTVQCFFCNILFLLLKI